MRVMVQRDSCRFVERGRRAYPDEDPLPLQVDIGDGQLARQRHFGRNTLGSSKTEGSTQNGAGERLECPVRQLCWETERKQVHALAVLSYAAGTLSVICNEGFR